MGLGSAGDFAVLAGSGATNTDVSTVSGGIESAPTPARTGFEPCTAPTGNGVVQTDGTTHGPDGTADSATTQAKDALTTAYDDAAGRTSTPTPVELGGTTLTAGVYSSGTFGITGTLTLSGGADDVFIFQTASTLVTAAASRILLTGGASECNIFWKVGSAATLGASSTFRGTILAHDDISLGDGVTVQGRLLAGEQPSGAGAVTLIHDTVIKPDCAPDRRPDRRPHPDRRPDRRPHPDRRPEPTGHPGPEGRGQRRRRQHGDRHGAVVRSAGGPAGARWPRTRRSRRRRAFTAVRRRNG